MDEPERAPSVPPAKKPWRGSSSFLLSLVPVGIFWLLESRTSLTTAVVAAMVFGVGELAFSYYRHRRVDGMTLASTGLVVVFGVVSLVFDSGLFLKLKPSIFVLVTAAVCAGSVAIGRPVFGPLIERQAKIPATRKHYIAGMTLRFAAFCALHALAGGYAALELSTEAWLLVKGAGGLIVLGLFLAFEVTYIKYVLRPRWLAIERELRAKKEAASTPPAGEEPEEP